MKSMSRPRVEQRKEVSVEEKGVGQMESPNIPSNAEIKKKKPAMDSVISKLQRLHVSKKKNITLDI